MVLQINQGLRIYPCFFLIASIDLFLWSELFDSDLQQNLSSPVFESHSQTPGGFFPIKSEEYITYLNHKNIELF